MAQATRRGCQKRGCGVRARKTSLRTGDQHTNEGGPASGLRRERHLRPTPSSPRSDLLSEPPSRPRQQRWPPRQRAPRQPPRRPRPLRRPQPPLPPWSRRARLARPPRELWRPPWARAPSVGALKIRLFLRRALDCSYRMFIVASINEDHGAARGNQRRRVQPGPACRPYARRSRPCGPVSGVERRQRKRAPAGARFHHGLRSHVIGAEDAGAARRDTGGGWAEGGPRTAVERAASGT